MDELNEFINHDDNIISSAAKDVNTLKDALDRGDITQDQFEELVNDNLELEEVRRMASNLDRKIMILQAFTAIRTIVGAVLR